MQHSHTLFIEQLHFQSLFLYIVLCRFFNDAFSNGTPFCYRRTSTAELSALNQIRKEQQFMTEY